MSSMERSVPSLLRYCWSTTASARELARARPGRTEHHHALNATMRTGYSSLGNLSWTISATVASPARLKSARM